MAGRNPRKVISKALSDLSKTTDPRKELELACAIRTAADDLERAVVARARDEGVTWTQIGATYGMSKQAAQQRFRPTGR